MGLVFEGYPNIHGKAEHYEGGVIVPKMKASHFDGIKSRYLTTMRQQLERANNKSLDDMYSGGLSLAQFEDMEAALEQQVAETYNNAVNGIGANIVSQGMSAIRSVEQAALKQDEQGMIKSFNDIIALFKKDVTAQQLIDMVNNATIDPIDADLSELLQVQAFMKNVQSIMGLDKSSLSSRDFKVKVQNSLNSVLTSALESLPLYVSVLGEQVSDDLVFQTMKNMRTGTQSETVNITFKGADGFVKSQNIETKSADFALPQLKIQSGTKLGKNGLVLNSDLTVNNYVTAKTYRSKASTAKLISYASSNAIAMNVLHSIYGENPETDYQLYNTLAFSGRGSSDLVQNFKVIRSDMIAAMAEKYIIGYSTEFAQRIMIHNFKAYPILTILSAIAEQAKEQVERNGIVNTRGLIFSIVFDDLYKIKNTWKGDSRENNLDLKLQRIREVKAAIDRASTRGMLNFNQFNKFIKSHNVEGISLNGIIPKT